MDTYVFKNRSTLVAIRSQTRCDSQSEASMLLLMFLIGCRNMFAIDLQLM